MTQGCQNSRIAYHCYTHSFEPISLINARKGRGIVSGAGHDQGVMMHRIRCKPSTMSSRAEALVVSDARVMAVAQRSARGSYRTFSTASASGSPSSASPLACLPGHAPADLSLNSTATSRSDFPVVRWSRKENVRQSHRTMAEELHGLNHEFRCAVEPCGSEIKRT